MQERLTGVCGLFILIGLSYLMSNNKKAVKWKTVFMGVLLQFLIALFILKTPYGRALFESANAFFKHVVEFSGQGVHFVFGILGVPASVETVFGPGTGFIFAIQVAGTIIFMSSLMCVLYYLGIMQKVVYVFAVVMRKLMGTSGSESLAVAANIFIGQTESPLVIRPYLERMTNSEIMTMMVGGMAHIAGGVMAAYVSMGIEAGHLLAGSVMSAPATMMISKLFIPETRVSETAGQCKLTSEKIDVNIIDAACRGATEGVQLVLNIMAVLIAFIALVAMLNYGIAWLTGQFMQTPLTLQSILGYLFMPFAYIIGVPHQDVFQVGSLLGTKIALNEFVAYSMLGQAKDTMDPRSVTIATYALCGFANFSSIAIQIGGIGSLMPSRRKDLARLGLRAMIAGVFCTLMTATIAGILL